MVFQHFALLPHLTVLGNVAFPLEVQGVARAAREERARQMDRWRGVANRTGHVTLGTTDADDRLTALVGHTATVFGSLERILPDADSPRQIVFLAHRRGRGFPMVVFDPEVWSAIDLAALTSRFVTVRGTVTLYRDRPQIVVTDPAQVAFP